MVGGLENMMLREIRFGFKNDRRLEKIE